MDSAFQDKIGQAAIEHANHALLQINKDVLTFKELLPDMGNSQMKRIR